MSSDNSLFVLNYRLSIPKQPGSLTMMLRTIIEIESEYGLLPQEPIDVYNDPDDAQPACVVHYVKADARKLIAGKMSENEYFIRHLTPFEVK